MTISNIGNLYLGDEDREFFVWVDPNGRMIQHNLGLVGSFVGGPLVPGDDVPSKLPFQPNSEQHAIMMTPFHSGLISWYMMDYNLEQQRHHLFPNYPSRLHALYLLSTREDAERYRQTHPAHVVGRILKRCVTVGGYKYSIHDSSWIEFLRVAHMLSDETINNISDAYWQGHTVEAAQLMSHGVRWTRPASPEVLFYGRVDFPSRSLAADD